MLDRPPGPEAPERTETAREVAVEAEPSREDVEAAAGEALELKDAVEKGPAEVAGVAAEVLGRIESDPEIAAELEGDADFAAAKAELGVLGTQAEAAAARAKARAGGVFAKFRRWAKGMAAVGIVAGAVNFLEGCATVGAAGRETGIERVESGKRKPWEAVKAAARENAARPELAADVGGGDREALREGLESFDEGKFKQGLAALGADPARAERQSIKEIRFLTAEEVDAEAEKDPLLNKTFIAVTQEDGIWVRAKALEEATGAIDPADVKNTISHESVHVHLTEADQATGKERRLWRGDEMSNDMFEGITELTARRAQEASGERPPDQAYAGGGFAAAYALEQALGRGPDGKAALEKAYLQGDAAGLRKAVEGKLGEGAYDAIAREPEAILAALETIRRGTEAGIDLTDLGERGRAEGIREEIRVSERGDGIVLLKEKKGELDVAHAAFAGGKVTPNSRAPRVRVLHGKGVRIEDLGEAARKMADAARHIETIRDQLAAENPQFEKDKNLKRVLTESIDAARSTFDVTVNASDALVPLKREHDAARTAAEKAEVRRKVAAEMERLGREALAKIAAEIAAARGGGPEKE